MDYKFNFYRTYSYDETLALGKMKVKESSTKIVSGTTDTKVKYFVTAVGRTGNVSPKVDISSLAGCVISVCYPKDEEPHNPELAGIPTRKDEKPKSNCWLLLHRKGEVGANDKVVAECTANDLFAGVEF